MSMWSWLREKKPAKIVKAKPGQAVLKNEVKVPQQVIVIHMPRVKSQHKRVQRNAAGEIIGTITENEYE